MPECSGGTVVATDPATGLPIFALNGPSASNIFVPAGVSGVPPFPTSTLLAGGAVLTTGTNRFMCCIHPWMRTLITVQAD